jgi:pimeloyl-ACP methyl ester carboxylesterase
MQQLDLLTEIPLVMMGYSFGTYVAYNCVTHLQNTMNFRVSHFISICGLSCHSLLSFQRFDDGSFESLKKNLVQLLEVNFGRLPSSFERALKEQPPEVIETIMKYFYESVNYMHRWAIEFTESNKLLDCDMLYVRGTDDPTTKDDLWRVRPVALASSPLQCF